MQPLERLYIILEDLRAQGPILNDKLADYVFFPLSHVFRESKSLPARAVEIAVHCLQILVSYGWRDRTDHDLGKQLLILLTFLAGGSTVEAKGKDVNEELSASAFECLAALFEALGSPSSSTKEFTDIENIPVLGHAVTVMLDGILEGPSSKVQMAALCALHGLLFVVLDRQARIGFFPGVVSSLTKVLQPSSQSIRSYKILEASLTELRLLIQDVLGDDRSHLRESDTIASSETAGDEYKRPNEAHLKAWSAQVKLALANVTRLRHHSRPEIRKELFQLCVSILEDCRQSLSESATMVVETLLVINSTGAAENDRKMQAKVKSIMTTDIGTVDILISSLHNWIIALPRIIQSNDDTAKARIVSQISTSLTLIEELCIDSDVLQEAISNNLVTSIASLIQLSSSLGIDQLDTATTSQMLMPGGANPTSVVFPPILMDGHKDVLYKLRPIVERLTASPSSAAVARRMTESLRNSSGHEKVASLWLLLRVLDDEPSSVFNTDQFLDLGTNPQDSQLESLEHVYSISLELLAQPADVPGPDWRLQALALEAVALQARRQRLDFRPELVDALCPVVERIGSGQPALREHAMTCLNILSVACGYNSSSDLIIANVDYLVNAVALKLNTFDISPQAPRVLLMMVKLCGPSLIPYLDDLVESIFAALACFHGYPRLVESLFSVLGTIVDEGNKTAASMPLGEAEVSYQKKRYGPLTVADVAEALRSPRSTVLEDEDHTQSLPIVLETEGSPTAPTYQQEQPSQNQALEAPSAPPPSKTYTMVQAIARLGQHYLTNDSPILRRQLLLLTATACSTLSRNEDESLPLINDIWPVVVKRLYDSEPYVSIAAADAVSTICECAGHFMASRIEAEWHEFRNLYWKVHRKLQAEKRVSSGRGNYTPVYQVWDALVKLLITLVHFVRLEAGMEDDIFDMLGKYINARQDIREALTCLNADAAWLETERQQQLRQGVERARVPVMGGFLFREMII